MSRDRLHLPTLVPGGAEHDWTLTQPSTEGREAFECTICGVVVEHFWGMSIHKGSLILAFGGGPLARIAPCKAVVTSTREEAAMRGATKAR